VRKPYPSRKNLAHRKHKNNKMMTMRGGRSKMTRSKRRSRSKRKRHKKRVQDSRLSNPSEENIKRWREIRWEVQI
jgi:hypothetical protein